MIVIIYLPKDCRLVYNISHQKHKCEKPSSTLNNASFSTSATQQSRQFFASSGTLINVPNFMYIKQFTSEIRVKYTHGALYQFHFLELGWIRCRVFRQYSLHHDYFYSLSLSSPSVGTNVLLSVHLKSYKIYLNHMRYCCNFSHYQCFLKF